ncbi:MAG TPA: GntR family transcriptional regulator [Acidobacteriota bacterium]|nr:GntR family transcriptional regulator [Acidobacteriota bacterium]
MAHVTLSRISKSKLSQQVYEVLLRHIINKDFERGQKLDVDELAQQLGISRTPVKEALSVLGTEGLIEVIPHIGTFVKDFSAKEIADTFDIRRALEVLAAETLLDNVLSKDVAKMEAILKGIESSTKPGALETRVRKNYDFHKMLIELSGNRKLLRIYESLHVVVSVAQTSHLQDGWQESAEIEDAEHRAILEAIKNRDRNALIRAITVHLERAKSNLMDNMKAREAEVIRQPRTDRPSVRARFERQSSKVT